MGDSYDFIIVGGGTAGLVVATRLSEDPNKSILVLEAGADLTADPRANIPIFYAALLGSESDWAFRTEPQPGLNGRVIGLNQGKALGGSSALNAHVFVPPSKSVIDSWEVLGNPGWNWNALRSYFAKSYTTPAISQDSKAREALAIDKWAELNDASGPIQTSFGNEQHPVRKAWAESFVAKEQYHTGDPFAQCSVGAFSCLSSISPQGTRSYATSAYFKPAETRGNLHVLTNVYVEKIVVEKGKNDSSAARATAVQYRVDGAVKVATANKEVILAAGALQSPKILQLSGVGPSELLHQHAVETVVNLPGVGQNLQDHLISYTAFEAKSDLQTKDDLVRQEPEAIGQAMQEYTATQSGPLASLGVHTYAYLPLVAEDQKALKGLLSQAVPDANVAEQSSIPDYREVTKAALLDPKQPSAAYLTALAQTNYPTDLRDASTPLPSPGKFVTFGVMLSQPLSRGSIQIASSNPQDSPIIDPGYLSDPLDTEVIARHMLRIKALAESAPFKAILAQPLTFRDPAANFEGDLEAAKQYARANLISMWHFAGTCAMLPREKGGVVDNRLRVYGVENLRVVDASAIPLISTANIQATVYAFAERAADLIKEDW